MVLKYPKWQLLQEACPALYEGVVEKCGISLKCVVSHTNKLGARKGAQSFLKENFNTVTQRSKLEGLRLRSAQRPK